MDEPLEIWIPAVVLLGFYLLYQRKNLSTFGAVSFIVAVYVGMCFLSVFSKSLGGIESTYDINLIPVSYLSLCLVVSLWGFFPYRDDRMLTIKIENYRMFRIFEKGLLLTTALAFLFFLPYAVTALRGDIDENRKNLLEISSALGAWGYMNSFFSLIAGMFAVNMVFAFLNLTPELIKVPNSKRRAMLLLLSSTIYIVYVLAYVGRDGVVFWIMTFIFLYLFFRKFIRRNWAINLKKVAIFISGLIMIPFSLITFARFSVYGEGSVMTGLWMYVGDQVHAFNDQFLTISMPNWGKLNFPLLYRFFDPSFSEFDRLDWITQTAKEGVMPWHFSTFVGALMYDFGYFVTPLVVLLIALMTRLSLRGISKNGTITFSQLLIFLLCTQIVLYGVFYFRQYSANLYIITILILSLVFKISGSRRYRVLVKRADRAQT